MCGRFFLEESPELRPIVEAMNRSPLLPRFQQHEKVLSGGEIRPTNVVPAIASSKSGRRTVFPMKWGFGGTRLLINAKTETAAVKPAFREAWASHRCSVPASWYFEWEHLATGDGRKKTGDKFRLHPRGAAVTWLCGLYRIENGLPCFVILTREPSEEVRFIHDRMPLMMPENCVDAWISPTARPEELVREAASDIAYERAASGTR